MNVSIKKHQKSGLYHVYCNGYRSEIPMEHTIADYHKNRIQGGELNRQLDK